MEHIGIRVSGNVHWNPSPKELITQTVELGMGELADSGALVVNTGKFKGRAPQDRFIVKDANTADKVDWGSVNQPFDPQKFDQLHQKAAEYLGRQDLYVRDAYACADPQFRLKVRVVSDQPWQSLFAYNMFIRPEGDGLDKFVPDWHVISSPNVLADPVADGTRQENFVIINFSKRIVLIGGTGYTGEIKKSIFSVLNFILPTQHHVFPMHCSANVGSAGDVALFFGLSGTGKTTLSADPQRSLIGDDEHGWSGHGIFNFEGGCYAKCVNLTDEKEPQIFRAIRDGALLENTRFFPGTKTVNYADISLTENTRVSYPLHHIHNAVIPSVGPEPRHVFFLTCDAFGVLPPISKLTPAQAMYHFMSGYTAKVAGTEHGVSEPQATFSACFGAPFLPLHPARYADMLGSRMKDGVVSVWLVNTGWTGGGVGTGHRISLHHTRSTISAALNGALNYVAYETDPIFGLSMPLSCPGVDPVILNPRNTWSDKDAYDHGIQSLAQRFISNFSRYEAGSSQAVVNASPRLPRGVESV